MLRRSTKRERLWPLFAGPTIWSLHFLASYVTAAVYCAKTSGVVDLTPVRLLVAAITVLSIAAVLLATWLAHRHWGAELGHEPPHHRATLTDRRRFLGTATLMLSGLSIIGILYVALVAMMIGTCR